MAGAEIYFVADTIFCVGDDVLAVAAVSRPQLILTGDNRNTSLFDELFSSSGAGVSHGRAGAHSEAQWDRYPECSFGASRGTPGLCWRAEREDVALREGYLLLAAVVSSFV